MNVIERYLRENKMTYQAAKRFKCSTGVTEKLKAGIFLIGEILGYKRGKKKTDKLFADLERNKNIFAPCNPSVHSIFYLPLVDKDRGVNSDAIQYSIFMLDNYYEFDELDYIRKKGLLKDDSTILDIGANIGNHTLFFANECSAKHIYAFEPTMQTFSYLKKNVEINKIEDKVTLYNYGVGENAGMSKIEKFSEENIGGTTLQLNDNGNIPIIAIDELNIDSKIDFVKIDTEGFEIEVIKGMMKLVSRDLPYIWVEASKDHLQVLLELLLPLNYQIVENLGTNDYILRAV